MGISIELSFQCQPLINDTDNKSYFKAAVIIKNTIAALTSLFISFSSSLFSSSTHWP